MKTVPVRSKHFILWPIFNSEKDAKDVAATGVFALAWIAISDAWTFSHLEDGEIAAVVSVLIAGIFAYFTFRLNRVVTTVSFLGYVVGVLLNAIGICPVVKPQSGITAIYVFFLLLFQFNTMRAAFWYHGQKITPKTETVTP